MSNWSDKSTILVVENDADLLHVLQYHLSKAGFEVHAVTKGEEAIDYLQDETADLVIANSTIPDMDGFSLRKRLFLDASTRDIPFLMFAPGKQVNGYDFALRNGLDEFMDKPLDPLFLIAHAQSVIARQHAHHQAMRIDSLTRVLNRTTFEEEIEVDLARLQRYDRFGSLMIINIDDFAKWNEDHGAGMGDLLLAALASLIAAHIRSMDLLGRHVAGSFSLYLPETYPQGAQVLAERLLAQFKEVSSSLTGEQSTFSAAIIETPKDGSNFRELCERANNTLKSIKNGGAKGAVAVWREESQPSQD